MRALEEFPCWSVWLRDYADLPAASFEHWVLFVVEDHVGGIMTCRVLATQVPADHEQRNGPLGPGAPFTLTPESNFAQLVKRVT